MSAATMASARKISASKAPKDAAVLSGEVTPPIAKVKSTGSVKLKSASALKSVSAAPAAAAALPTIEFHDSTSAVLQFTLENVNLSHANAIRRVILSDIPTVVFDDIKMLKNTTRLNNELIQQRLRCIPIHVGETEMEEFLTSNFRVEINATFDKDHITFVTTKDFQLLDTTSDSAVEKQEKSLNIKSIFPPFPYQDKEYYIDIARLRPPITAEAQGDVLHFTAGFKKATAKEDKCYNVASTCSYGFTIDLDKQEEAWEKEKAKFAGLGSVEMEFKKRDWEFLDGKRFFKTDDQNEPNSFAFIIETVGPFTNKSILQQAIAIIRSELARFLGLLKSAQIPIVTANATMENCYDVQLHVNPGPDEPTFTAGYTIGKVIEAELHKKFLSTAKADRKLTFCAFRKPHPHIDECYIRVAGQPLEEVAKMLEEAAEEADKVFQILYDITEKK